MTTIAPLPPAPQPSDDEATFDAKSFAMLGALDGFGTQANALAGEVNAAAATAVSSASQAVISSNAAVSSAQAAAASAGASAWVSGTTYAIGDARWSPADGRVYRRRTAGAGATDPSLDPTNWSPIAPNGLQMVTVATTTATVLANTDTLFTNAAQCAATVPAIGLGDSIVIRFDNGRRDNTIDIGARSIKGPSGVTLTGVITHNSPTPLALRWWGDYYRSN